MKVSKYEETYVSVKEAMSNTEYLDSVVEFLKAHKEPVTAKEIGLAVFGVDYTSSWKSDSYRSRLGQMLCHLREGKFIQRIKVDDNPIEITDTIYVRCDDSGRLATIRVHDDEGNSYDMPNPNFNPRHCYGGKWVEVKKKVYPHHNEWLWIGD